MAKKKATFEGAMSKVSGKAWAKAREVEVGGGNFELPEIANGEYPCLVTTAKADVADDGPYVSFGLVVKEGEYEGTKLDKFHMIKDQEKDLERLVKTIKGMGYTIDDRISPAELIKGVVEDINNASAGEKPGVMVKVENYEYEVKRDGKKFKKGQMAPGLNVYINRPLAEGEGETPVPATKKTAAKATKVKPAKKAAKKK